MYDNHNSYVDESKYSLDEIAESIELIGHDITYSMTYETLDGIVHSEAKTIGTSGTGIVIEKKNGKAYILTNNHVTEEKTSFNIQIPPSKWFKIEKYAERLYVVKGGEGTSQYLVRAKKVASNPRLDVALLEVDDDARDFKKFPYKIGNSDDLRPGDFTWIIGNPLGLTDYALKGNVSKLKSRSNSDWFMIGSDVQAGYSGGAVIAIRDGEYELVGIVVATLIRPDEGNKSGFPDALGGYGIVIRINPTMKMVDDYFDSIKKKDTSIPTVPKR